MFKKILTYGLAFGSIAGAFLFVHLKNYGGEISDFQKGFYVVLQSIIIPFTCVYLLIKSVRNQLIKDGKTDFKAGTYIIVGLFSSLVLSLTFSSVYAWISSQFPSLIENAALVDIAKVNENAEKYVEFYKQPIEEIIQVTRDRYNIGNQFRENMFQYSSMGLFISGIMALVYLKRDKKLRVEKETN